MDYFYLMVALFSCSCYTTLLDTQLFLFSCCGSYAPKASEVISCNREFEFEFKTSITHAQNQHNKNGGSGSGSSELRLIRRLLAIQQHSQVRQGRC
jgi:hypothetical protein